MMPAPALAAGGDFAAVFARLARCLPTQACNYFSGCHIATPAAFVAKNSVMWRNAEGI